MPKPPRVLRRVAALGAIALLITACGGNTVEIDGHNVTNAPELLAEADDVFRDLIADDVAAGITTASEDSRCYFRHDGENNVDESLFCGPVRSLGGKDHHAWYEISTGEEDATDDGVSLEVVGAEPEPVAVDDGELFRPDGDEPIAVSALDEPQAPEAPIKDVAALLPLVDAGIDAEFEELDVAYTLTTPTATITVEAAATLDAISDEALTRINGADDASSGSPLYRPAEGQRVLGWHVTIASPPDIAPDVDGTSWYGDDGARDASAALALGVGSQRLSIIGDASPDDDPYDVGYEEDDGSFTIPCDRVACEDIDKEKYLLIASIAEEGAPTLIVTIDGEDQTLSLADGTVTSDVSRVADSRQELSRQVSTTWPTKTITIRTADQLNATGDGYYSDDTAYVFGGEIQRVYLSPFDYAQGWAPTGKAWLVVPIVNRPDELTGRGELSMDWAKSMTLTVGGQIIPDEPDTGAEHTAVFLVDDTFTEGTLTYRPTGSVKIGSTTYPLTTKDPLTLPISFP